jgi:hypothetical protein
MIRSAVVLAILTLLMSSPFAGAETIHCVSSSAELQDALDAAAGNDDSDVIKVARGDYPVPAGGFVYESAEMWHLSIRGDYLKLVGVCVRTWPVDPSRTTFVGADTDTSLEIDHQGMSSLGVDIEVQGFSFEGGLQGLYLHTSGLSNNSMTVDRCVFTGTGKSFDVVTPGSLHFLNNRVTVNRGYGAASGGGRIVVWAGGTSSAMIVTNNTFANNLHEDTGQVGGLQVEGDAPCTLSNNIFYHNESVDLRTINTNCSGVTNNLDVLVESPADAYTGSGDISLAPQFAGLFNYHLSPLSPLIDAGTDDPVGGLTTHDLDGLQRVNGAAVDIGCYELQLIFTDGFESGDVAKWSASQP